MAQGELQEKLRKIVQLRKKLLRKLRKMKFFAGMSKRSTEMNFIEQVLFFKEASGAQPIPEEIQSYVEEISRLLHEVAPGFRRAVHFVLAHYRRRISFSNSDINQLFEDLQSECYIGLLKGLLRIGENCIKDLDKVEHYLIKVIRSHIKNVLGYTVPIARIPQSRWFKIPCEERNSLIPRSLEELKETENEENNGDNFPVGENFPCESVELAHYISKLPQPYRGAIQSLLDGEVVEPAALQKLFALYAYLLYKVM